MILGIFACFPAVDLTVHDRPKFVSAFWTAFNLIGCLTPEGSVLAIGWGSWAPSKTSSIFEPFNSLPILIKGCWVCSLIWVRLAKEETVFVTVFLTSESGAWKRICLLHVKVWGSEGAYVHVYAYSIRLLERVMICDRCDIVQIIFSKLLKESVLSVRFPLLLDSYHGFLFPIPTS